MIRIVDAPPEPDQLSGLKNGDIFYLEGIIYTARDAAHQRIISQLKAGINLPETLSGQVIYHCGPLARQVAGDWEIVSAGPTTSARLNPLMADFLTLAGPRILIGKGGMSRQTCQLLEDNGSIYAQYTGGAGVLAAAAIKRIKATWWLEDLGMAEAVWVVEVERFGPLVVNMKSYDR